jgi:hypothetical protein
MSPNRPQIPVSNIAYIGVYCIWLVKASTFGGS